MLSDWSRIVHEIYNSKNTKVKKILESKSYWEKDDPGVGICRIPPGVKILHFKTDCENIFLGAETENGFEIQIYDSVMQNLITSWPIKIPAKFVEPTFSSIQLTEKYLVAIVQSREVSRDTFTMTKIWNKYLDYKEVSIKLPLKRTILHQESRNRTPESHVFGDTLIHFVYEEIPEYYSYTRIKWQQWDISERRLIYQFENIYLNFESAEWYFYSVADLNVVFMKRNQKVKMKNFHVKNRNGNSNHYFGFTQSDISHHVFDNHVAVTYLKGTKIKIWKLNCGIIRCCEPIDVSFQFKNHSLEHFQVNMKAIGDKLAVAGNQNLVVYKIVDKLIDIVTVYNDDGDSDDENGNGNVPSCVMTPPKVLLDCALHVGLIDVKNFDLDDHGVTIHHSDSDPRNDKFIFIKF